MSELTFRQATRADLPTILAMLAHDQLGATREDPNQPERYYSAFDAIENDPNNELIVACQGEAVVGTLQLTFTPGLSHTGSWRATVEAVRIHDAMRGQGLGSKMFEWVIARARERNCRMVQLTTDKQRLDAKRFYERLGFVASHEGMKLILR